MSTMSITPAQRAELALSNSDAMCKLLAECRTHKVPGWWDASAFRSHPVGLIVGTIKLTNFWHVDHLCTVYITDGDGWSTEGLNRDSRCGGSTSPAPVGGSAIKVWRCGAWEHELYRESLEPRLLKILTDAAQHIQTREADRMAREATDAAAQKAAADAALKVALSKAREVKA